MTFYIGCNGWKSQTWAKNFYPDGLDPLYHLSYYSNTFNFVHIDLGNSDYTPSSSSMKKWLNDTPDNFRFSIRVPQKIIDNTATSYSSSSSSTTSFGSVHTNPTYNHRDLLGHFLENLNIIEEKILVIILSPPSYITLQNNGRKWLEDTLKKCTYHGYSVAVDFDKRNNWYQELTYNILKKYKSSFVWSNSTHQYYYPAVTSNFILLDVGNSYLNKQTATRYLDLIRQKAIEGKHHSKYSANTLDYCIIITKNPPVAQLIQKLVSVEENSFLNFDPIKQVQNNSLTWHGRVVMHIDMNAFFPACEELRDASLKGKPHAVIMTPEKDGKNITRGAVASCSYEARRFGVRSAMSLSRAKELCPNLILRPVDKEYYSSVSQQVMRLLEEYADVLEQTSIDEAFIDCTKKLITLQQKKYSHDNFDQSNESLSKEHVDKRDVTFITSDLSSQPRSAIPSEITSANGYKSSVEEYALKIKSSIREQCNGLICSIGVANNKSIAKIASDFQKPDGLTIVYPENTMTFLSKLKVEQVSGIGIKTAKTLKDMGISTVGELSQTNVQKLLEKFGKRQGLWMWQIANGRENDAVIPKGDNISLSTEETLLEPINDRDEILKILLHTLTDDIYKRLERKGYEFKTVGIKLVRTNFSIETREFTFPSYQRTRDSISSVMEILLDRFNFENSYVDTNNKRTIKKIYPSYIRKLGIKVSNLSRIDVATKRAQKSMLDFI
jgi:DNA polymerase IV (DinB-like DNA polymerase)